MKNDIDCRAFEEQLDALTSGELAQSEIEVLRAHASYCADCAVQLRINEHLSKPSLREIEAAVPEELARTVWPRLQGAIGFGVRRRGGVRRPSRFWAFQRPALAAASLLLAVSCGLLLREVIDLRRRESALLQQVADQERWLAGMEARTGAAPVARTAGLAASQSWQRALARSESVTVSELGRLLASLSPRTTVLDSESAGRLARAALFPGTSAWKRVVADLHLDDGLQAGEALELLQAIDLEPDRSISTARFLDLFVRS
ncbi:MAG: zf-HC2 domain-containing protein [Gemmatimonadota bacterium]|nr:MAG: zf-HC2 domain-containing protein [Gemmatimonadota bacterium]